MQIPLWTQRAATPVRAMPRLKRRSRLDENARERTQPVCPPQPRLCGTSAAALSGSDAVPTIRTSRWAVPAPKA